MPVLYRVLGKYARLEGGKRVKYRPGDTLQPTPREVEKLGEILEPIAERAVEDVEQQGPTPTPTPEPDPAPSVSVLQHRGGGWYELPDGSVVRGKEGALAQLGKILREGEE